MDELCLSSGLPTILDKCLFHQHWPLAISSSIQGIVQFFAGPDGQKKDRNTTYHSKSIPAQVEESKHTFGCLAFTTFSLLSIVGCLISCGFCMGAHSDFVFQHERNRSVTFLKVCLAFSSMTTALYFCADGLTHGTPSSLPLILPRS